MNWTVTMHYFDGHHMSSTVVVQTDTLGMYIQTCQQIAPEAIFIVAPSLLQGDEYPVTESPGTLDI